MLCKNVSAAISPILQVSKQTEKRMIQNRNLGEPVIRI